MHLSISVRFTLKQTSKEYRGPVSEHVTWARKGALSLFAMARQVLAEILDWYAIYAEAIDMAQERDKLVEWLQGIHFVEPEKGEGDGERTR
jgi:hypothetical protein